MKQKLSTFITLAVVAAIAIWFYRGLKYDWDSDSAHDLLTTGYSYLESGESNAACNTFTEGLATCPVGCRHLLLCLHIGRGKAYVRRREFDLALDDYDKAIELDPTNEHPWAHRGDALDDMGEYDLALESYTRAIELNEDSRKTNPKYAIELYARRGHFFLDHREYAKAIEDFTEAIPYSPDFGGHYYYRGRAFQGLGDEQKARRDFEKAEELGYEPKE